MKAARLIVSLLLLSSPCGAQVRQPVEFKTDPPQRVGARFRLFATDNIVTFLLLDTATGRVWQLFYGVQGAATPGMIAINDASLIQAGEDVHAARFTLYKTPNFYNFVLVDQDAGAAWQCQWGMDSKTRFLAPMQLVVDAPAKVSDSPAPAVASKPKSVTRH